MLVRYPTKTNTKRNCDTIATSIARYEKYRYWASKSFLRVRLRSAPPHTGSPGPFGPRTRKSPKRVRKEYPGAGPQSAERVHPGVSNEAEKSPKVRVLDSFRTLLRLWGFTLSALLGPCAGVLFPDSFRTLRGSGPEGPGTPCVGRGRSQAYVHF